jgi:hypothetical protein
VVLVPVLAFAVAVTLSAVAGTPPRLPGIALGWPLLLHVERATALLAAVAAFALVAWRTARGELPVRLGQLEYERGMAGEAAAGMEAHERRLTELEGDVARLLSRGREVG